MACTVILIAGYGSGGELSRQIEPQARLGLQLRLRAPAGTACAVLAGASLGEVLSSLVLRL